MSFLPYGKGSALGWIAAGTASVLVHGALIVGLALLMQDRIKVPVPDIGPDSGPDTGPDSGPNVTITAQRFETPMQTGPGDPQGAADQALTAENQPGPAQSDLPQAEPPQPAAETAPQQDGAPPAPVPPAPVPPSPQPVPEKIAPPDSVQAEPASRAETTDPVILAAPDTALPGQPDPASVHSAVPDPASDSAADPVAAAEDPDPQSDTDAAQGGAPAPVSPRDAQQKLPASAQVPVAAPTLPAPTLSAAPGPPDPALAEMVGSIRANSTDPCLLALPLRDAAGGLSLAMLSSDATAMAGLAKQVLGAASEVEIAQTRTLVDPRQCPALSYVRQSRAYPATALDLALDAAEVPSGGTLRGVLRGVAGRYVLLLLVDNNGVVQDLQPFMSLSGDVVRFAVPVTRVGAPRDTAQLLLAIATRRPAADIRDQAGHLAQDVFSDLDGEAATSAALALSSFDVR